MSSLLLPFVDGEEDNRRSIRKHCNHWGETFHCVVFRAWVHARAKGEGDVRVRLFLSSSIEPAIQIGLTQPELNQAGTWPTQRIGLGERLGCTWLKLPTQPTYWVLRPCFALPRHSMTSLLWWDFLIKMKYKECNGKWELPNSYCIFLYLFFLNWRPLSINWITFF